MGEEGVSLCPLCLVLLPLLLYLLVLSPFLSPCSSPTKKNMDCFLTLACLTEHWLCLGNCVLHVLGERTSGGNGVLGGPGRRVAW